MRKHPLLALATAVSTFSLTLAGAVDGIGASITGHKATAGHTATHSTKRTSINRRRARARRAAAIRKKAAAAMVLHKPGATLHTFVPLGGIWQQLRACESGGDYQENTGNGYYGAYQFALGTWRALGGPGIPSEASPALQDQMAVKLESADGWRPWPSCSWQLNLA